MGLGLFLQIQRGGQVVREEHFDSDAHRTIKVGRLNSAQLRIEDPKIARIHAVIELSAGDISLTDMGSTAGTTVNGAKVQKVKLNHGDLVALGDTSFLVGVGSPAHVEVATAPAVTPAAAPNQVPPQGATVTAAAPAGVSPEMVAQLSDVASPVMTAPAGQGLGGPPRFDGGGSTPAPMRRITQDRLRHAAVESKAHPSLPPEEQLTADNRVIEMRTYWGELLLGMNHYDKPKKITIGESKKTDVFISSEGLPIETFPLVRYIDDEYVLTFCDEMDGEIEVGGEINRFNDLKGSSLIQKDDEMERSYQLKMATDSKAVVHWGGATFAMRFVAPAKPVPLEIWKNMDLQFINLLLISLFFHVALILTLLIFDFDTPSLEDEVFDAEDRFAKLIMEKKEEKKDLKEKPKEKPKKEKEKEEEKPKEKEKLKVTNKQKAPKQEKTKAQKSAEVREKFSKVLSGSSSMLGGGAGGTLAGTITSAIGTRGKSSMGLAGMGIRGSSAAFGGGIGTSRGAAGIGTSGRLGGGGSGYGAGVGLGRKKASGRITFSTPVVRGSLDPAVIKRVIEQNKKQVRYCYEVQLQRNQNLEGRIMMNWIISATGSVAKAKVQESSMKGGANVERCIASKIKTWKFPAPAGGGIVEVNYPFVFKST